MAQREIYITQFDMDRLMTLIEGARRNSKRNKENLDVLEKELLRGKLVSPENVPGDVITMNSEVIIRDLETNEETTYILAFPSNSNISANKISILAPLGMALLGYRVGDTIEWQMPSGIKKLKVIKVLYQPEAAGHFDL